jgi:hypothetical protein
MPGHIILATAAPRPPNDQLILVYTLLSLTSRWRPVTELANLSVHHFEDRRIGPDDISPTVIERLAHNNRVCRSSHGLEMTLHPNPIRHNTYKLTVYASYPAKSTAKSFISNKFRQRLGGALRRAHGRCYSLSTSPLALLRNIPVCRGPGHQSSPL